jgi:hypothetical protein
MPIIDGRSARNFPKPWTGLTVTAAMTSQATGFQLESGVLHEFDTVPSGGAATLPNPVEVGREVTVSNNGSNALLIYPQSGGTINAGSTNADVSLAAGSSVTYWATTLLNWQNKQTSSAGSSGTVTSVTFTGDGVSTAATASSPAVTTSGTNTATPATASANTVVAGPATGSPAALAQRALVAADLPTVPLSGLATISTLNVVANTTGGTAAPAGVTLSALFDAAIDNAQGDLVYRGASTWGKLVAGGTAGQLLQTGGSGANPSWATSNFTIDQTNLCPKWTAISDPGTPAAGDRWLSSTIGRFAQCRAAGWNVLDDGTFFRCGSCTALSNFTGPSSLFGSPTNSWGSLTIPANMLKVGDVIELWAIGNFGVNSTSITFAPTFLMGSTAVVGNTATVVNGTNTTQNLLWGSLYGAIVQIYITAIGSSGGALGLGFSAFYHAAGATTGLSYTSGTDAGTGTPITINTTNSLAMDYQITCSVANANSNMQISAARWRIG